jgi:hypothetical protein
MSTSPSEDEQPSGEILKASSPGASEIKVGMQVTSLDGKHLGTVKEVRVEEFLLNRPLARDLWVPFSRVLSTEDYGTYHGPVEDASVVLEVGSGHIDQQGWRHA